jgi:hypothetical protein
VSARSGHRGRLLAPVVTAILLLVSGWPATGQDGGRPPGPPARAYLIHLAHGTDPIVVAAYAEEDDAIVFEKYGGRVSIPRAEVVRIVADGELESSSSPPYVPRVSGEGSRLLVAARNGANLRVEGVQPEADGRARLLAAEGSMTLGRDDVLGILKLPGGRGLAEAWLFLTGSGVAPAGPAPVVRGVGRAMLGDRSSEQPHVLRLTNGQLVRVEGFWIDQKVLYFRRLGGIVGIPLGEVARILPEVLESIAERIPVRFLEQLGPDRMLVGRGTDPARVVLIGVRPTAGTWTGDSPWHQLAADSPVQLELDRRSRDGQGNLLAYVFLANGRMLNAELIRLGLAEPCSDGANVRYLDLFHELAATSDEVGPCPRRP